jgi:hypothetical protein
MENDKLLNRRRLENGMDLHYYDISRKIAGDRWMVGLKCEVLVPVVPFYFDHYQEVEPGFLEELKTVLGQTVSFAIAKERNFIADEDKDKVLNELVEQVDSTVFSYLNNPKFPEKIFRQKIEKTMQKLAMEKAMNSLTNLNSQIDDDEGPADFSFCFKE